MLALHTRGLNSSALEIHYHATDHAMGILLKAGRFKA